MNKKFIYIDESGFENSLVPIYGYSRKNQPMVVNAKKKDIYIFIYICTIGCQWELSMVTISCTNVEFKIYRFICNILRPFKHSKETR